MINLTAEHGTHCTHITYINVQLLFFLNQILLKVVDPVATQITIIMFSILHDVTTLEQSHCQI